MDPSHVKRYTDPEIETHVVVLLNRAYPDGVVVPIDIDLLVEQHHRIGDIIFADLEDRFKVAATLVYRADDDLFDIICDENAIHGRTNFSIAHELGHVVLHEELCKGCTTVDDAIELQRRIKRSYSHIETEANRFASFLLMPRKAVTTHTAATYEYLVKEHGCDGEYIQSKLCSALARLYKVSQNAMEIRLERLGLQKKITAALGQNLVSLDI